MFSITPLTVFATTENNIEDRLQQMEKQLQQMQAETDQRPVNRQQTGQLSDNGFNPAISITLDGGYASYKNDPEDYSLPGYILGGEAGLAPEGFSIGHSELTMSNNIDNRFFGQVTLAVADHEGETEVELEEAFFETLSLGSGLGSGLGLRGGRFYSAVGYLNQQHQHAWDFYDAPLVYRGIFGNQYFDDGMRLSYIVPTELYFELGAEAFAGKQFPAGGEHHNIGSWTGFLRLGGDIGLSHSWQAGLSYWRADDVSRDYASHSHDGEVTETPLFEGDSDILGVNAVYKWAPYGNYRDRNLKLQFEYFKRDEDGQLTLQGGDPLETSSLSSRQDGWYLQAIWQFAREWRMGARIDSLDSDNTGDDSSVLDEAGLSGNGFTPERSSIMAEWLPSEFSRLRLQYNHDESYEEADEQLFLQYTFSIGAHGAHEF